MSQKQIEISTNAAARAWQESNTRQSYEAWLRHQKEILGLFWGAKEVL